MECAKLGARHMRLVRQRVVDVVGVVAFDGVVTVGRARPRDGEQAADHPDVGVGRLHARRIGPSLGVGIAELRGAVGAKERQYVGEKDRRARAQDIDGQPVLVKERAVPLRGGAGVGIVAMQHQAAHGDEAAIARNY